LSTQASNETLHKKGKNVQLAKMSEGKLMEFKANLSEEIRMAGKERLYTDQELSQLEKLNNTINPCDWTDYINPNETSRKKDMVQTARSIQSYNDKLTLKDLPTVYKENTKPPS